KKGAATYEVIATTITIRSMKTGAVTAWRPPSQKNGLMPSKRRRRAALRAWPRCRQRSRIWRLIQERGPTGRSRHDRLTRHVATARNTADSPATARSDDQ